MIRHIYDNLLNYAGDVLSSSPSPDNLYALACAITSDMQSPASKSATDEVHKKVDRWNREFVGLSSEDRDILSLQIATTSDMVKMFLTFADSLLSGLLGECNELWVYQEILLRLQPQLSWSVHLPGTPYGH